MRVHSLPMLALLALGAAAPSRSDAQGAGYIIVVHEANRVSSLSTEDIARIFLKRTARWPGGEDVIPVDRNEGAGVRDAFSRDVLRKTVAAVKSYWQTLIFSGQAVPPVELASDDAVVAFVRGNPGAIGYVSAHAAVGAGVRAVAVTR